MGSAAMSAAETETRAALHVATHPLIQHKLGLMREAACPSAEFRRLLGEIAMLLCYEVTRDLPVEQVPIETPLEPMMAPRIAGRKLVLAPVLRAGLGMLDGMLALLPAARVAHVGIYRNPTTLEAVEYYFKAPADVAERLVLVLDPMLATANSAVAAVERFKARGCRQIRFVCLLASPEGIRHFHEAHPDVPLWTAAVDRALDDHGYIRPGLGDAGDRIFGTA
jgi:uracil phosphoribosyltransferase